MKDEGGRILPHEPTKDTRRTAEVAASYGVLRPAEGFSERAIFVIDKQGKVSWSKVYAIPEQPANRDVLAVLERLSEGSANRDSVK